MYSTQPSGLLSPLRKVGWREPGGALNSGSGPGSGPGAGLGAGVGPGEGLGAGAGPAPPPDRVKIAGTFSSSWPICDTERKPAVCGSAVAFAVFFSDSGLSHSIRQIAATGEPTSQE